MNQLFKSLGVCALLALGGAASAQTIGPRGPGEDVDREERRQERRQERREQGRDADRGDRPDRADRPDRGDRFDGPGRRDRADRRDDVERRDRFEDRRDRRDRVDTRIVVRPGPSVRYGTVVREPDFRPGYVVTQPLRPTRVVCRLVQERRLNPATGVLRVRPVRECSRFVGRRRVIVSRRVAG